MSASSNITLQEAARIRDFLISTAAGSEVYGASYVESAIDRLMRAGLIDTDAALGDSAKPTTPETEDAA